MTQKIAVAIIHGMGTQPENFAEPMKYQLEQRFPYDCRKDIIIQPIYWADLLSDTEKDLLKRLKKGGPLWYQSVRAFLVNSVSDAFAYQITGTDRRLYDAIHGKFAQTLHDLAQVAGHTAPLCIIAHSLGSVIASNYLYDLQYHLHKKSLIQPNVRAIMGKSPTALEAGETFTLFYTMGSPIALWSLRYYKFGMPIHVPDKRLKRHHHDLCGEWVNFYDAADVIGAPIKTLNKAYKVVVTEDREVKVGNELLALTPLSHVGYWTDEDVLNPIATKLIKVWKTVNPEAA